MRNSDQGSIRGNGGWVSAALVILAQEIVVTHLRQTYPRSQVVPFSANEVLGEHLQAGLFVPAIEPDSSELMPRFILSQPVGARRPPER